MTASPRRPRPYRRPFGPDSPLGAQDIPHTRLKGRPPVPRPATLLAIDITRFSGYTANAQVVVRDRLYDYLIKAFEMTGLPWWASHREDRGDGVLLVSPPDAQPDLFLDPLAHHLRVLLRQADRHDPLPLRLRMAVHHGSVLHDAHGVTGSDLILLYRLLDAPAFRQALNAPGAQPGLGMIISDSLYRKTAGTSPHVNPAAYRRLTITCKELRHSRAWLWNV